MISITKLQERDSCLAFTFLCLLLWLFNHKIAFIYTAMGIVLFGMIWPSGLRPLAYVWFGLGLLLGKVMSKVVLSVVYVMLLLPVALVRRLMGKDSLGLLRFCSDQQSCFVVREHTYQAKDLVNPY